MTVACPRHGVVVAAADTPCPDCGVALYDLADRAARVVVRANRFSALATRRTVFSVIAYAVGVVVAFAIHGPVTFMNINVVGAAVAVAVAKFGAEPFAKLIETKPALRELDRVLAAQKI